MKTLASVLCCVCLLGLSVTARADGDSSAIPFYVGLDLGHVSVSRGSLSATPTNAGGIDGSGSSWSLLGGYFFTENFGFELGYHDYGKPNAFIQTGLTAVNCPASFSCPQVSGETAEVLGKMEVVPQLDGILRLGVQQWNVGSPGGQLLGKTSGTVLVYGLGVRRNFDYGLGLEITYEHSSFSMGETRIGVSYSF